MFGDLEEELLPLEPPALGTQWKRLEALRAVGLALSFDKKGSYTPRWRRFFRGF